MSSAARLIRSRVVLVWTKVFKICCKNLSSHWRHYRSS